MTNPATLALGGSAPLSRRSFLRTLGWSVGGCIGAGLGATWPLGQRLAHKRARTLRLGLLGDVHLMPAARNATFAARLSAVLAQMARHTPRLDAVLFTGNMAYMGDAKAQREGYALLEALEQRIAAPVIVAAGAHDWHRDAGQLYTARYGAPHALFKLSEDVVVLKVFSADVTDFGGGAHRSALSRMQALATPDDPRPARFSLTHASLAYARTALAQLPEHSDVIVLSHTPLYDYFRPWNFVTTNASELDKSFKHRARVVCVHGQAQHPVLHAATTTNALHVGAPSTAWSWPYPLGHRAPPEFVQSATDGCGYAVLHLPPSGQSDAVRCDYHLASGARAPTLSLTDPHRRLGSSALAA